MYSCCTVLCADQRISLVSIWVVPPLPRPPPSVGPGRHTANASCVRKRGLSVSQSRSATTRSPGSSGPTRTAGIWRAGRASRTGWRVPTWARRRTSTRDPDTRPRLRFARTHARYNRSWCGVWESVDGTRVVQGGEVLVVKSIDFLFIFARDVKRQNVAPLPDVCLAVRSSPPPFQATLS